MCCVCLDPANQGKLQFYCTGEWGIMNSINVTCCRKFVWISIVLFCLMGSSLASAAKCGQSKNGFSSWLRDIKSQAASKGISQQTLKSALDGVTYDPRVIRRDRSQRSFKLSFNEFYKRRVGSYLLKRAAHSFETAPEPAQPDRKAIWRSPGDPGFDLGPGN